MASKVKRRKMEEDSDTDQPGGKCCSGSAQHGKRRKKIKQKHKKTKTCNLTIDRINLDTVIESFRVKFLKAAEYPKWKDVEQFEMEQTLSSLLSFIDESITAEDAIAAVLNLEDHIHIEMEFLHYYKSYDFPTKYDGYFGCEKRDERLYNDVRKHAVGNLLSMVEKIEAQKDTGGNTENSKLYDLHKSFCCRLFRIACEELMTTGETTTNLPLVNLSASGDDVREVATRVTSKPDIVIGSDQMLPCIPVEDQMLPCIPVEDDARVASKPDIVIGSDKMLPCIPVEVYSPLKYKDPYDSDDAEDDSDDDLDEKPDPGISSSTECGNFAEIKKFLNENLPCDFVRKVSKGALSRFQRKLTQQLVVQLLGSAKGYIKRYFFNTKPMLAQHTAIGLFVFRYHLFIGKLTGKSQDILESSIGDFDWHAEKKGLPGHRGFPLDVSFFPAPLDIQKPSHSIALLFFIRYYREIFNR